MTMPGYAGWVVQLDPSAVSTNRTMLDINNPSTGIQIGGTSSGQGVDWGLSSIQEYTAQQSRYGSTVADYVWPNRTITIPLVLGTQTGSVSPNTALQSLREKVALFQREGGWLLRQRSGALNLYADVVDAQLQVPDAWGEGGAFEPGVTLTLIALPDFYGDEITLDSVAATGVYTGVAKLSGATATILGDHPSRCPVIVTDTSGNSQLGLIWGVRSRYYDSAATAALFYEAEALTPVNGAAVTGLSGASGGDVVKIASLPTANWVTMLSTTVAATTGNWTHQGSYRVWARCYSSTGTPQFQLLWGVGSLSVPVTNDAVTLPGSSAFYLLDLGEVRLDAPPVGTNEWFGAIQSYSSAGGDSASVDCIYLQPLDEAAGVLTYAASASASDIAAVNTTVSAVDVTGVGTATWTLGGTAPQAKSNMTSINQQTHYLEVTGLGLSVPSGVTIQGVEVAITHFNDTGGPSVVKDAVISLIKAGTVSGNNKASATAWPTGPTAVTYGSTSDLWGLTLASTDVNASNFGVAISATAPALSGGNSAAYVYAVTVTVYYIYTSGFIIAQDAVIYANQNMHLRHDGMWREAPTATVYGVVSQIVGDFCRLPPSGMENRPCQLFIKPTRGDLNVLPDSGLDGFTVQPQYQACYIFRP